MKIASRSPFAMSMLAQAALLAAARSTQTDPAAMKAILSTEEKLQAERENALSRVPPPEPPKTQRIKIVDDAGLAVINRSREERRRINAARAERAARTEAGKARS